MVLSSVTILTYDQAHQGVILGYICPERQVKIHLHVYILLCPPPYMLPYICRVRA